MRKPHKDRSSIQATVKSLALRVLRGGVLHGPTAPMRFTNMLRRITGIGRSRLGEEQTKTSIGLFLSLVASVTIFVVAICYRTFRNPGFEIRNYEFLIALLPLLLYGLLSGKVARLEIFGFKLESKFRDVVHAKVGDDYVRLHCIEGKRQVPCKEDEEERLSILRKPPDALEFVLTDKRYSEKTIEKKYPICAWLDLLSTCPTFKYVIFRDSSRNFRAFVPARSIAEEYTSEAGKCEARKVVMMIIYSKSEQDEKDISAKLPGLVWNTQAASKGWQKRYCLNKMQDMDVDVLPVVENGKFLGVIEKSRLVASLIIDVSSGL